MTTKRVKTMKKVRRIVWKIWKCWLVISIPLNILSLLFMACCMDSDTVIPAIVATINASWLLLICISNDPYRLEQQRKRKKKEKKENETKDQSYCA